MADVLLDVVRIAGIFAIITGGTYSGVALLFALVSFSGLWAMYMAFCKLFPKHVFGMALAILFIPSTIFWPENSVYYIDDYHTP